jgi:hypothetical protein
MGGGDWIFLFIICCTFALFIWFLFSVVVIEGIDDQCHPNECSSFVGNLYSGYNQSFVVEVESPDASLEDKKTNVEVINFCKNINGGQTMVGLNEVNYNLDNTARTFTCKNPFQPSKPLTDVNGTDISVNSIYDSNVILHGVGEATAYCSKLNGLGSPLGNYLNDAAGLRVVPNFIVPEDGSIGCRSQFDSSVMTWTDASNALWRVDPTISVATVDELKTKCMSMNGGRDSLTNADGSFLPLYTISPFRPAVLFECNSYWTGAPIKNSLINEKVIYNVVTDASFTTHQDQVQYCGAFGSKKWSLSPLDNVWKFNCISDITGQDMTADQYTNGGKFAYEYSPDISFNSMDKLKAFCGATDPVIKENTFKCGESTGISFAYQITPNADSGDVQLPTFTSYDDMVTFTQKFGLKPKILNPKPNTSMYPNPTFTIDGSFCSAYD